MRPHKLSIKKIICGNMAVSSIEGQIVHQILDEKLQHDSHINLDFEGINIISAAFLNSAIGQLFEKYESVKMRTCISAINTSIQNKLLIKKVIDSSEEYYSNKEKMDKIIEDVLSL